MMLAQNRYDPKYNHLYENNRICLHKRFFYIYERDTIPAEEDMWMYDTVLYITGPETYTVAAKQFHALCCQSDTPVCIGASKWDLTEKWRTTVPKLRLMYNHDSILTFSVKERELCDIIKHFIKDYQYTIVEQLKL